jgi:hypothetical protein
MPGFGEKRREEQERKKQTFLEIYQKKGGIIYLACEAANVGRTTYFAWMKRDPQFAAAVKELDDYLLDFTESKLMEKIQSGNLTAMIFYLKCKGKKRGWVERQEVTGAEGVPLVSGVSEEEERRLRSLSVDDLKRIRDIIQGGNGHGTGPAAGPDRQTDSGEEPPRVH